MLLDKATMNAAAKIEQQVKCLMLEIAAIFIGLTCTCVTAAYSVAVRHRDAFMAYRRLTTILLTLILMILVILLFTFDSSKPEHIRISVLYAILSIVAMSGSLWGIPIVVARLNPQGPSGSPPKDTADRKVALNSSRSVGPPEQDRAPVALFIGDGFAGKTQIIRALAGSYEVIEPIVRTAKPEITEAIDPLGEWHFFDYRGQDFKQVPELIDGNNLNGGRINAIVLVISAFCVPEKGDMREKEYNYFLKKEMRRKYKSIDENCLRSQIFRIGGGFMDVLFGATEKPSKGKGLRSVFLFVNKIDKILDWGTAITEDYVHGLESVKVLESELIDRCGDEIAYEFITGSAITGEGVAGADGLGQKLAKVRRELKIETSL